MQTPLVLFLTIVSDIKMEGPDCILPSESLTTTAPEGCVKIRDHDPDDLKGMIFKNFKILLLLDELK